MPHKDRVLYSVVLDPQSYTDGEIIKWYERHNEYHIGNLIRRLLIDFRDREISTGNP